MQEARHLLCSMPCLRRNAAHAGALAYLQWRMSIFYAHIYVVMAVINGGDYRAREWAAEPRGGQHARWRR